MGKPVEKAPGNLGGSCSPGKQGDHQDGSPGSWFPVVPLSLPVLGFTQHTLWSTGWGLDRPGMLGPGPLGGDAGRGTFGGPAPPTVQAVPATPTLVTGTSAHLPAAGGFSSGRVSCRSVRGREEVEGAWRGRGQLRLRLLLLSRRPLGSSPPPTPWPGVDTSQPRRSAPRAGRARLSASQAGAAGTGAATQAPPARQGAAHPTGLRMPLLCWRTDSPLPGLPQRPADGDGKVSWVTDAPTQIHTLNLDPQHFWMWLSLVKGPLKQRQSHLHFRVNSANVSRPSRKRSGHGLQGGQRWGKKAVVQLGSRLWGPALPTP